MLKEKVLELREKSGYGLIECRDAISIFDGNVGQASEYLKLKSQAVCRRKANGELWQKQDYVNHIKSTIKEDE